MSSVAIDGTTLIFGSTTATVASVHSIDFTDSVAAVETTNFSSTKAQFVAGMIEKGMTIEIYGTGSIDAGTTAATSITWNDGTSDNLGNMLCSSRASGGKVKGAIVSRLTFVGAPA